MEKSVLIATAGERAKAVVARLELIENEMRALLLELRALTAQLTGYNPALQADVAKPV